MLHKTTMRWEVSPSSPPSHYCRIVNVWKRVRLFVPRVPAQEARLDTASLLSALITVLLRVERPINTPLS